MPIRNVTTDYSGRQKDINVYGALDPRSSSVQPVAPAFGPVSSYCAGVQKLLQRYAISLLTVRGSQPAYPTFGTDLLKTLNSSGVMTSGDLTHTFNFANASVISQFRAYQEANPGLPADEQLDTAMLLGVTSPRRGEVNYRIAIYTKAGETLDFLLPIPITK